MDDSSIFDELLTPLRIQFLDEYIYEVLMASSDVDQKFLGKFAQQTARDDPLLSAMLYKILGLSVLLSKKLFRARRLRRLDVTRDTKSLQLYHHIIWLSREGLVLLEEYVIPLVRNYSELKVLVYKLRGSFYHIFVLFHNQPSINRAAAMPSALSGPTAAGRRDRADSHRSSVAVEDEDLLEQTAPRTNHLPPGLAPISIPKPAASFLLPAIDYIPTASQCFERAMTLATGLLSGSHPLRLSVAVEYCAYLYDCLHDGEASRKLAQRTIRAVYNASEGMDDETFADSANLVGVLGKMMRRGLGSSAGTSASVGTGAGRSGSGTSPGSPKAAAAAAAARLPNNVRQGASSSAMSPRSTQQGQEQQPPPASPSRSRDSRREIRSNPMQRAPPQQQQSNNSLYPAPLSPRPPQQQSQAGPFWSSWDMMQPQVVPPPTSPPRQSKQQGRSGRTSPRGSSRTQKPPKMTPWEPPSPETALRKRQQQQQQQQQKQYQQPGSLAGLAAGVADRYYQPDDTPTWPPQPQPRMSQRGGGVEVNGRSKAKEKPTDKMKDKAMTRDAGRGGPLVGISANATSTNGTGVGKRPREKVPTPTGLSNGGGRVKSKRR